MIKRLQDGRKRGALGSQMRNRPGNGRFSVLNTGFAKAFTGILPDIGANGGNQFQGGGSKDNNDISQWLWKPGEPLDKDDITDAYAACYIYSGPEKCPAGKPSGDPSCTEPGDLIIFFGLDRFANNGSAQVGFWFFQNPIGLTNIPQSGGFQFSGVHSLGDILIQSNFSQGGVIDSISVFKWVGSGGSNGALNLVYSAQDCVSGAPASDLACATAATLLPRCAPQLPQPGFRPNPACLRVIAVALRSTTSASTSTT